MNGPFDGPYSGHVPTANTSLHNIGMDQMQDVYLSEAFSTAKKPWSISFVAAIEHLFHVFMIGMFFVGIDLTTTVHLNVVIFVSSAAIILFGLILVRNA